VPSLVKAPLADDTIIVKPVHWPQVVGRRLTVNNLGGETKVTDAQVIAWAEEYNAHPAPPFFTRRMMQ
jgi:hypothetical protein